jgi:hypothetical protein
MIKKIPLLFLQILIISCGEQATGDGIDGIGDSQHRIFVSSTAYDGNLGGIAGADSKCSSLASSAGLEREYKAFIGSTSTSLKSRFSLIGSVYNFRSNGDREKIVNIGSDLFDADVDALLTNIEFDENGNSVNATVWTGSDSEGENGLTSDCQVWTSNGGGDNGSVGDNSRTTGFFLEDPPVQACSGTYRIYCISI